MRSSSISTRVEPVGGGVADIAVVPPADRHQPLADIGRRRRPPCAGRARDPGAHSPSRCGAGSAAPASPSAAEIAQHPVAHAVADVSRRSARAARTAVAAAWSCRSRIRRRRPSPRLRRARNDTSRQPSMPAVPFARGRRRSAAAGRCRSITSAPLVLSWLSAAMACAGGSRNNPCRSRRTCGCPGRR